MCRRTGGTDLLLAGRKREKQVRKLLTFVSRRQREIDKKKKKTKGVVIRQLFLDNLFESLIGVRVSVHATAKTLFFFFLVERILFSRDLSNLFLLGVCQRVTGGQEEEEEQLLLWTQKH